MFCCGIRRVSNYCSECGKKLETTPKEALIDFMQKAIKRYESDAKKCEARLTAENRTSATLERRKLNLEKAQRNLKKYQDWLELVQTIDERL